MNTVQYSVRVDGQQSVPEDVAQRLCAYLVGVVASRISLMTEPMGSISFVGSYFSPGGYAAHVDNVLAGNSRYGLSFNSPLSAEEEAAYVPVADAAVPRGTVYRAVRIPGVARPVDLVAMDTYSRDGARFVQCAAIIGERGKFRGEIRFIPELDMPTEADNMASSSVGR